MMVSYMVIYFGISLPSIKYYYIVSDWSISNMYRVGTECFGVNEFRITRNRVTRNSNICAWLKSKSNQTNQII